jgi:hypothetical protein
MDSSEIKFFALPYHGEIYKQPHKFGVISQIINDDNETTPEWPNRSVWAEASFKFSEFCNMSNDDNRIMKLKQCIESKFDKAFDSDPERNNHRRTHVSIIITEQSGTQFSMKQYSVNDYKTKQELIDILCICLYDFISIINQDIDELLCEDVWIVLCCSNGAVPECK